MFLYYVCKLLNNKKGNKMKYQEQGVVYDNITGKGILIVKDELYLIKDGKKMKLNALIIKDREEN